MQINPQFDTTTEYLKTVSAEVARYELMVKSMKSQMMAQGSFRFNGATYNRSSDDARLTGQLLRVFECMKDGQWRTLDEISAITGDPQASVSAQLRHLRKERFGSHEVEKRSRGDRENGLWEYRVKKSGATFSDYPHHL